MPLADLQDEPDEFVLVSLPPAVAFVGLKEEFKDLEDAAGDPELFFWILAVLTFGFGDIVSSFLAFSRGATELNPFMNWALHLPGALEGLLGFVLVKTVAMLILFAVAHAWEGIHRWLIPLLMTIAGVYLTSNNLMLYLRLP